MIPDFCWDHNNSLPRELVLIVLRGTARLFIDGTEQTPMEMQIELSQL